MTSFNLFFQLRAISSVSMPSTWDPTTLAIIDELMIALDPAVMDSLSPKYLVSALPYILLNKTYHDNHYDSFPGFVGKVHFSEVRHFESLTQVHAEERFLTKTSWSTGCCSWHWFGGTLAGDKFAVIFFTVNNGGLRQGRTHWVLPCLVSI